MIEFFYQADTGQSKTETSLLKHHFTFDAYYAPTKLGRSTLRRVDCITLNSDYMMSVQRHCILILYSVDNKIDLTLNSVNYSINKNELLSLVVPKDTYIKISTHTTSNILLCECDIIEIIQETIDILDIHNNPYKTDIHISDINGVSYINPDKKPFFGLILDGNMVISQKEIYFYDGFYTDNLIEIKGKAKILTFTMPHPL